MNEIWPALFCNKCKIVTQTQLKCDASISLPIYIKNIIRGPNRDSILEILGAQWGLKKENYLKKVKALLQVKINCIKVVLKSHVSMIQL